MKRIVALFSFAAFVLAAAVAFAQPGEKTKIVFHVDSPNPARLEMAFHNAHSVESREGKGNVRMVVVANGPAVRFFVKRNAGKFKEEIDKLVSTGDVEFHVCETSLKAFGYKPSEVLDKCKVVPAGILDIVKLEKEGYTYIKP